MTRNGTGTVAVTQRFGNVSRVTSLFKQSCDRSGGVDSESRRGLAKPWGLWGVFHVRIVFVLLFVVAMGCGLAASVTISMAPAYADNVGEGY